MIMGLIPIWEWIIDITLKKGRVPTLVFTGRARYCRKKEDSMDYKTSGKDKSMIDIKRNSISYKSTKRKYW